MYQSISIIQVNDAHLRCALIRFFYLIVYQLILQNLKSECLIAVSPGSQLRCSPFVWQNLFRLSSRFGLLGTLRLSTRVPFGSFVSQLTNPIQKNLRFAPWLRCVAPCSRELSCLHVSSLTQKSTLIHNAFFGSLSFRGYSVFKGQFSQDIL